MKTKFIIISLLGLFCLVISCRNTETNLTNSAYNVKVNLTGIEYKEGTPEKLASIYETSAINSVQKRIIKVDESTSIVATLTPINSTVKNQTLVSMPMAAKSVSSELRSGVKYKVAVYDDKGNYVDEKEFTYQRNETDGFLLKGDQNYTFIAYSTNSTSSTPSIENRETLTTAKLSGIRGDFMYFKKNMTVSGSGVNNLDVILKHQFSEITTKLDALVIGNITSIGKNSFFTGAESADMNLNTGIYKLNNILSEVNKISFPNLGSTVAISTPTIIIANTESGILFLKNIIVANVTKNLTIDNLKILPGVKYNLNIKLKNESATISTLNCQSGTQTGTYIVNKEVNGNKPISYTNGNGQSYESINISSTGVTGLTATAPAGILANGNGSITLKITGKPTTVGKANFIVNLGGKSCGFSINVSDENYLDGNVCSTTVTYRISSSATQNYTINYTGGNGQIYNIGTQISLFSGGQLEVRFEPTTLQPNGGNINFSLTRLGNQIMPGQAGYDVYVSGKYKCSGVVNVVR